MLICSAVVPCRGIAGTSRHSMLLVFFVLILSKNQKVLRLTYYYPEYLVVFSREVSFSCLRAFSRTYRRRYQAPSRLPVVFRVLLSGDANDMHNVPVLSACTHVCVFCVAGVSAFAPCPTSRAVRVGWETAPGPISGKAAVGAAEVTLLYGTHSTSCVSEMQ